MGDDPLPEELVAGATATRHSSAATGGSVTNIHTGLSKDGQLAVVIVACLGLGISIGAVVVLFIGRELAAQRTDAAEKRAMDAVYVAQQNAALAREDVRVLTAELNKRGIAISTSH